MYQEFIDYQEAKDLKELGFKEKCGAHYLGEEREYLELKWDIYRNMSLNMTYLIQAPVFGQAFRFFREKYNLEGEVHCIRFNSERLKGYQYAITSNNYQKFEQMGNYDTYEEAQLECLKKLIEIAKNN
jgi:hypothetical protein